MAADPYETLGLKRDAGEADIRSAYRKLAKQHHPDLNPGNKAAEERFKAISAANDLLSDPERRGKFDRGEINADGEARAERPSYGSYAEGGRAGRYRPAGEANDPAGEYGDIFADLFGRGAGGRPGGAGMRMRGRDAEYALEVRFLDAINGTTTTLTLPDGRGLEVKIPPGVEEGQVLRLRGQGGGGLGGGPSGDALIELHIAPHRLFRREGRDVHAEVPVTLREAVLGARIPVPTPGGPVTVTVPPRSDTGTRLRLRGRGVAAVGGQPAGDEYVTLKVVLGDADDALAELLRGWTPADGFDPRRGLEEP